MLTALLTAFYTFRLLYLIFAGEPRGHGHPHKLSLLMLWPLWPLSLLGVAGGLFNLPALLGGSEWLTHRLGSLSGRPIAVSHSVEWLLIGLATALVLLGWLAARWRYARFQSSGRNNFV